MKRMQPAASCAPLVEPICSCTPMSPAAVPPTADPPTTVDVAATTTSLRSDDDDDAPLVHRLYKDALASVFAFLTLEDLHATLMVCSFWSRVVDSMPRLSMPFSMSRSPSLVPPSALRRHIGFFISTNALDAAHLSCLSDLLPHMRELFTWMTLAGPRAEVQMREPIRLPRRLQRLTLYLESVPGAAHTSQGQSISGSAQSLMDAIGELSQLEELTLALERSFDPDLRFGPLTRLHRLHTFAFDWQTWSQDQQWSDEQVAVIRDLPSLTALQLLNGEVSLLHRLTRPPHPLQWREIGLERTQWTDDHSVALPTLPSLTSFTPGEMSCTDFDFLARLPQLSTLRIEYAAIAPSLPRGFVSGLQSCAHLTDLIISSVPLTSAHLSAIFDRLTRLRTIKLSQLDELSDLSCFIREPLTRSLNTLRIWYCRHPALRTNELITLRALSQLTQLDIFWSMVGPLDAATSEFFTLPSPHMPNLIHFQYRPRPS
jgi:hypothetical protein